MINKEKTLLNYLLFFILCYNNLLKKNIRIGEKGSMTEANMYNRQGIREMWNQGSYEVGYCRLTVIDVSKKITEKEIDDLFIAFQEDWFEEAFEKLKRKYKKLRFQSQGSTEYEMEVRITNPKLKSFKKK